MLSALFKAFTGRAGGLGSLLALLIIALIAYTVVDRLPGVEQNVLTISQDYLDSNMAAGDTLMSLQADGRDVHLGGEFQDPAALKVGLESIEGVRRVFLIGSSLLQADAPTDASYVESKPATVDTSVETQEGTTNVADKVVAPQVGEVVEAVTELLLKDEVAAGLSKVVGTEATEAASPADSASAGVEEQTAFDSDKESASEQIRFEESSLELRYDGTQVKLSGHVGDDKMAELLVEAVSQALPSYSVLTSDVDGKGKSSPLNWMRQFLRIVSGLPEDAQGLISGSDRKGVRITPDEQQTLSIGGELAGGNVNESREISPARVDAVSEPVAPEQLTPEQAVLEPATLDPVAGPGETTSDDSQAKVVEDQTGQAGGELTAGNPSGSEAVAVPQLKIDPGDFIVSLNNRLSETAFFQAGEVDVSEALAQELDQLAQLMRQYPSLYLRIVGNIDSSVGAQFEELVGLDRARQVSRYLRKQQLDGSRIITAPLPRGYAFDKRVQLVFYISE